MLSSYNPRMVRASAVVLLFLSCAGTPFGSGDDDSTGTDPDCPAVASCEQRACGPDPMCGEDCGSCASGESCTLQGTCCVPLTCRQIGATCGTVGDGCGGSLDCGTCMDGEACGSMGSVLQCGCTLGSQDWPLLLAIDTVELSLHLDLDGTTVDGSNTTATDLGGVVLEPIGEEHAGGWGTAPIATWDSGTATGDLRLRVVPSQYRVHYLRLGGDPASPWPLGSQQLGELEITEDTEASFTIAEAPVTVVLTVDGEPVTAPSPPIPGLDLVLSSGPERGIPLLSPSSPLHLSPGAYDLRYRYIPPPGQDIVAPWPLSGSTILREVVITPEGGVLSIDLESVSVTLDLTLDGVPVTAENLGPEDGAVLLLDSAESPAPVRLGPLWDGGPTLPRTVSVLPGAWSVWIANDLPADEAPPDARWPANTGPLGGPIAVTSDTVRTLDVPTVLIETAVLLDGMAASEENTGPGDQGFVEIALRGYDRSWRAPPPWDEAAGAPRISWTRRLLRGVYDLLYTTEDLEPTRWPVSITPAVLESGRSLEADQSIVIEVPSIEVQAIVHLGPAASPEVPADLVDRPRLRFIGPNLSPSMSQHQEDGWMREARSTIDAGSGGASVRLLPGTYDIVYERPSVELPGGWPDTNQSLATGQTLGASGPRAITLASTPVGVVFAIDGEPVLEADLASREGGFALTRGQPRATLQPLTTSQALDPAEGGLLVELPAGHYLIHIDPPSPPDGVAWPADAGLRWPLTPGAYAGCLQVH